jgi:hypothetical protein
MALVDFNMTEMETVVANLNTLLTDITSTVTTFNQNQAALNGIWSAKESTDFAKHVLYGSKVLENTVKRYQEYITFLQQAIAVSKGDSAALAEAIKALNVDDATEA